MSLFISMAGAGIFCVAYIAAARSASVVGSALVAGKVSVFASLLAAAIGGIGIMLDRHKLLALATLLLGFLMTGFFGMLVYDI